MSALLKRLFSYLRLGVEGEEPEGTGDQSLDELLDAVEPETTEPAPEETPEPPAVTAANKRAQEAVERAERAERALRDAQPAPQPRPTTDPEYDAEEARLAQARASGASANDIAWIQWQIDTSRRQRNSERTSQQALAQANDLADRTSFEKLEITKPRTFKTYAPRIEKLASDLRAQGQAVPPRMMMLKYLIGEDALAGKVTPKTKAPTAEVQRVDRGRLPPARSDVRTTGKSDNSESAKRRARLENQLI